MLQRYMKNNEWPANVSKNNNTYFQTLTNRGFQDKNKAV
jgi:hypothetical protein